jgi:hypothetical protein
VLGPPEILHIKFHVPYRVPEGDIKKKHHYETLNNEEKQFFLCQEW